MDKYIILSLTLWPMTGTLSSDCHDDIGFGNGSYKQKSKDYCWTEWIWDLIDIDLDTDLSFSTLSPCPKNKGQDKACVLIEHLDGPLFKKLFIKSTMVSTNYIYAFPYKKIPSDI
ncbi:hypothetical protein BDB01DRAFT_895519, partial [Pilobolus umbonatus]